VPQKITTPEPKRAIRRIEIYDTLASGAQWKCTSLVGRMGVWKPKLIEAAFANAAFDPSAWVKALDIVVSVTESHGALLLPLTGITLPNVPFTERLGEPTEAYFRDNWHVRDERRHGLPLMVRRAVFDDLDIISADKINRHPYYQEFLRPHNLRWFAGVRVECGEDLWCLSIQRTIVQGPFSGAEKHRLAKLSDRLSASAALARALGSATAAGALQAFEVSGKAVVLINRHGEVFRANKSAEQLLTGDVRIENRRLIANDLDATTALNRSLRELMWRGIGGLSPPVALPRRGRRPILAYPAKLDNSAANALADCQALLILIDLDQQPRLPETVLRTAFNMTAAEARLAGRLAAGESLEFATEQIGIAKDTGRNQLKGIFMKTGVKRQSELVALLASILARTE
jgi:DNA-binding CsgD family transcriptional regulator